MVTVKRAVELHDSRIEAVECLDRTASVLFSHAYVHESEGSPGLDPGTGWSYKARLNITSLTSTVPSICCPFEIYDGSLRAGNIEHRNLIPVPFSADDHIRLHLGGVDDDGNWLEFNIEGQGGRLILSESPRYIEQFSGTERKSED